MQWEKVVETKVCKHCNSSFDITDKDLEFYDKISPVFNDKKYLISAPKLCSDCRLQRRLSFRNERKLYKKVCDSCWKEVVSLYSPDKHYKIFCPDCWWWDKFNPLNYGKDFDFNRTFWEQFNELNLDVPKLAIQNTNSENSLFTNYATENKNCYMVVWAWQNEECYYSYRIFGSKNIMDSYDLAKSEHCYECLESDNLFNCKFCKWCQNSSNLVYCQYCINCKNCFWCVNLRNKKYYIFNKPYSKEEYELEISKIKKSDLDKFQLLRLETPYLSNFITWSENVLWDQLLNCKNCYDCFTFRDSENCKYSAIWEWNKNSYDMNFWDNCEYQLDSTNLEQNYKVMFSYLAWYINNGYYLSTCFNSDNLFWCTWIKKWSYLIFNKQYEKSEYEILVPKIIEHMIKTWEWWEFFPSSISPFWYNETIANEYFPLSKNEALKKWLNWSDYEAPFPKVEKIIPASKLPDDITKIPDDILNRAIECEITKKPFKIIKQELDFYRKHNLPIPKRHPDLRHLDRMALRNSRKLFTRICDKCWIQIKTTYSSDKPEIIYCEECYNKEVY